MIEIKFDINEMLSDLEEKLKKDIEKQILYFNVWDDEDLTETVVDFIEQLVIEVLNENRDKIKKEIEEQTLSCLRDIIVETLSEKL